MSDGPLVTVERAAELLLCSRRQVYRLLADGQLERAVSRGRRAAVVTSSVLALALAPLPARRGRKKRAPAHVAPDVRLEDLHI